MARWSHHTGFRFTRLDLQRSRDVPKVNYKIKVEIVDSSGEKAISIADPLDKTSFTMYISCLIKVYSLYSFYRGIY